jgi:hypothetical protein
MIEDQESRSESERKRFPQLLHDPQTCRMFCDVEVQDAPAVVSNDEEAVKHAKCDGRDGEEVHCCDRFPMVPEEGEPTLGSEEGRLEGVQLPVTWLPAIANWLWMTTTYAVDFKGEQNFGEPQVKVSVAEIRVEHEVKLKDFTTWLERPGRCASRESRNV